MTDIGSSIVVASMIVGMLTIPAASKTIDSSAGISGDLPNISSSDSIPKQVATNSTSDSFTRNVETAFQEFTTKISSDSAKASVESADSRLDIKRTPAGTSWTLESSRGKLTVTQSASKMVEKVETPYGSLKKTHVNGGVKESFEGADREKVEEVAESLREEMQQSKQEIEQQRQATRNDQYERSLEIVEVNGTEDYAVIANSMSQPINLDGWKLTEDHGEIILDSAVVPAEGKLYVYSDSKEDAEIEEKEDANYVYDSGLGWDNSDEKATLWRDGEEVASFSY